MKRLASFALVCSMVACGGGDSPGTADGPPGGDDAPSVDGRVDSPSGAFALTSPAFAQDGSIPEQISCNGDDISPQLDWESVLAPVGTLSFAIVFTDLTGNPLIHSVIYDIPANRDGLPADVDKAFAPLDVPGAHQTRNFRGPNDFGYAGPCPGSAHVYEFALYALDVATLPGATMTTTQVQAKAIIEMHDLAKVALSGTYTP